ncbi:MAG: acyl-CoA reductase [Bacteroidetes bacterium]|nr:acyl-CoA reductase [Bacteroidota bacterium]
MLQKQKKIKAFSQLGEILRNLGETEIQKALPGVDQLNRMIETSHRHNPWFTPINVKRALISIGHSLTEVKLKKWLTPYESKIENQKAFLKVGVVNAGNIPAVGFHDFLCVLITNQYYIGKLSSDDQYVLPALGSLLIDIDPGFNDRFKFTTEKMEGFDAIIATGSNNTSRYFEYYFGKYPHIIRRNRNGVAVLTGKESTAELKALGRDIFDYFGLGCRNVSKLFVPKNYSFQHFFETIEEYKSVSELSKYNNNYDYYKSIYLVNQVQHLDNGFLLLTENQAYSSPPSVLYFEHYDQLDDLKNRLKQEKDNIQCVIGKSENGWVSFGMSQQPELWDYADGVDTLDFLLTL